MLRIEARLYCLYILTFLKTKNNLLCSKSNKKAKASELFPIAFAHLSSSFAYLSSAFAAFAVCPSRFANQCRFVKP